MLLIITGKNLFPLLTLNYKIQGILKFQITEDYKEQLVIA
jgi:hypothetical protein